MKLGIILETSEPEKAWNACRFANTALQRGHEVKLFLMGEAVTCESIREKPYDVFEQMELISMAGGEILACGTCLKSRSMAGSDMCPVSTMNDCLEMVEWSDKTVTF